MTDKFKGLLTLFLSLLLTMNLMPARIYADDTAYRIQINNGIHYLPYENAADGKIILFCMNNKRNWPHSTESIPTVPGYIDGYLTEANFNNDRVKYEECMNRLSVILYAGYPHNGLRLYQIASSTNIMTVDSFNEKLIVPDRIRSDFYSIIGDTTFSYSDYTNNTPNMEKLNQFLLAAGELFPSGTTASGLSYSDITATSFYKAANCMYYANSSQTPIQVFNAFYGEAYYVTEQQAYDATQLAVWKLLRDYGVEDNDLSDISASQLAMILLDISKTATILKSEPDNSKVHLNVLSDDYTLSYNPGDGKWYSNLFWISEDVNYGGLYSFDSLPQGISVVTQHGNTYVQPGEKFSFIPVHLLTQDETLNITTTLKWLGNLQQYSPVKDENGNDIEVNGKKFQHMAGALMHTKTLNLNLTLTNNETGITISKKVEGEENSATDFSFQLKLENRPIDGTFGDLQFHEGVAEFTLKDGESLTAKYLPQGSRYEVIETPSENYTTSSTNASGTLNPGQSVTVTFTNTRKQDEPQTPSVSEENKKTGSNPTQSANTTIRRKAVPNTSVR